MNEHALNSIKLVAESAVRELENRVSREQLVDPSFRPPKSMSAIIAKLREIERNPACPVMVVGELIDLTEQLVEECVQIGHSEIAACQVVDPAYRPNDSVSDAMAELDDMKGQVRNMRARCQSISQT